MKQDETRRRLIEGTIYVIACAGLDKATTKQIGSQTNTNEAYIYRCFASKEAMFAETFETLDDELFNKAMQHVGVMYMSEMDYELRCRAFFWAVWQFIVANRNRCLAYVRYYYSPYFKKYSIEEHKHRFIPLMEKIQGCFQRRSRYLDDPKSHIERNA